MSSPSVEALQHEVSDLKAEVERLVQLLEGHRHPDRLLAREGLAEALACSVATIDRLMSDGVIPRDGTHRVRGRPRFHLRTVLDLLRVRTRSEERRNARRRRRQVRGGGS